MSSMLQHNEVIGIRSKLTIVPRRHLLLFAFSLVYPFACLLAMPIMLIRFILFHMLFALLPSIACLLVFLSLPLHVYTWSEDAWSEDTVSQAQAKRAQA